MKITLDVDDSLLAAVERQARHDRITLSRLVEKGLQLRLRTARVVAAVAKGRGGMVADVSAQ